MGDLFEDYVGDCEDESSRIRRRIIESCNAAREEYYSRTQNGDLEVSSSDIVGRLQGLSIREEIKRETIDDLQRQVDEEKAKRRRTQQELEKLKLENACPPDRSINHIRVVDGEHGAHTNDSLIRLKQRLFKRKQKHEEFIEKFPRPSLSSQRVNLMPAFAPEEEDAYRLVMNGPMHEVLFDRFNVAMTRSEMQCLAPATWLRDEAINQYLTLLRNRSLEQQSGSGPQLKCYFHFTHFWVKLFVDGPYDYKNVKKWTKRGTRKCDLFTQDIVFFPINISNSHWALCIARIPEKQIEYYDSMGGGGKQCMKYVLKYLCDEALDKKNISLVAEEWKMVSHGSSVPQQDNCNDCGAFMCTFSNFVSMNQVC
uniref:Ubiquitin-like protease family profile domain-containing protein n=1 Tax=Mucochytrium quahogii TaxID=96639 RepID=A0A7S2RNR5_9STRA|mmetsp:Transcript_11636/g.21231  ORF Transcript_11636/g.21231 Transcript_11636/m.21231 type:complete len:368 (+) Transcript_11636:145-1248(+)